MEHVPSSLTHSSFGLAFRYFRRALVSIRNQILPATFPPVFPKTESERSQSVPLSDPVNSIPRKRNDLFHENVHSTQKAMKKYCFVFLFSLVLVACAEDKDSDPTTADVTLVNNTATKTITSFQYRESGTSAYGTDLIGGTFGLPTGGSHTFTISACDKSLDFKAGSFAGLFGSWELKNRSLDCGQTLRLTIND